MLEYLLQLDNDIFLLFNGVHAPYFDRLMYLLTSKHIWVPFYVAIVGALFATRRPVAALTLLIGCILTIALTDSSISHYIRPALCRLRPSHPDNPLSQMGHIVNGYRGGTYGFPSCHGANSFALAVFMALAARKRIFTFTILIWAVIHSYTRLYLGVHYPGDLIVGAMLGSVIGFGMFALTRRVMLWSHIDDSAVTLSWLKHKWEQNALATASREPWAWPLVMAVITVAYALMVSIETTA